MASVNETRETTALDWSVAHVALAGITLVGAVLRGYTLTSRPTPTDEAIVLSIVQRWSLVEIATLVPQGQPHWPTYFLLMDLWLELVGVSELAGRIPSVVFGVATVPIIFLLGRRLYDERVGLLAAVFVSLSPMHVEVSQIIRMYALLGFAAALSWLLLVRLCDQPSRRRAVVYLAGAAGLAYTHYYGFLLVGAQALYLLLAPYYHPGFRQFRTRIIAGISAITTPGTLWILHRLMQRGGGKPLYRTWREAPPETSEILRFALQYVIGTPYAVTFGSYSVAVLGVVVATGGLAYLYARGRQWSDPEYLLVLWVIVPAALALGVSELVKPMVRPRYFVGVFGIGGLLALAVATCRCRSQRTVVVALVVCGAMIGGLAAYYAQAGGPWDDVEEYVNGNAEQGDVLVTVGMYPGEVQWHSQHLAPEHTATGKSPADVSVSEPSGEMWVVVAQNGVFHSSDVTAAALGLDGDEYSVSEVEESGRLTVYRVEQTREKGSGERSVGTRPVSGNSVMTLPVASDNSRN